MEIRGFNPRSLSLSAGLNATAVRDMLEGRTRFPRYDTVLALSHVLEVTPSRLMGGAQEEENKTPPVSPQKEEPAPAVTRLNKKAPHDGSAGETDEDLELLTEIITRLQEVAEDYQHRLNPRDFAAMVTTIYKRTRAPQPQKSRFGDDLHPKIHDLMAYEMLRRRSKG